MIMALHFLAIWCYYFLSYHALLNRLELFHGLDVCVCVCDIGIEVLYDY